VISHELDALKYVAAGYRRSQLLTLVLERSRSNAAAGPESWGYSYAVTGRVANAIEPAIVADRLICAAARSTSRDPSGMLANVAQ
jgi:hypothetical protein